MGKQTGSVTSEIVYKSKYYNLATNTNTNFQYY